MRRSYMANNGNYPQPQYQDTSRMLEEENEQMESELSGKVKALKSLSIDIGVEVKEQHMLLSQMDEDFESSGGLLGKTMGRLRGITKAGHWKLWLYIALFAFFVFFMCWVIVRFR
ncbi:BET1 homolog [Aplysia californica]|uniref:BET1 homolog n=1 Tax=Aplysia californica TaxID=6500 RepID=A0ABM0JR24_APLCA|nr:BET1 homolog [Aplysia californica]